MFFLRERCPLCGIFLCLLLSANAFGLLSSISFVDFERNVKEGNYREHFEAGYQRVRIHFRGKVEWLPERFESALLTLRSQGFVVDGAFVEESEFDESRDSLDRPDLETAVPSMYLPIPANLDEVAPHNRRDFFRGLARKAIGAPAGLSGPGEIRLVPKSKHLVLMLITQSMQFRIMGNRGIPNLILATYLYLYQANLDGIYRMKNSGGSVRLGKGLKIESNYAWVTAQTTVEELIINLALRASFVPPGELVGHIPSVIGDSAFSGFAKSLTEQIMTALYGLSQEAQAKGNKPVYLLAQTSIQLFGHGAYNVLFPYLKTLQFPGTSPEDKRFSNAVQFSVGLLGLSRAIYLWTNQARANPADCDALISFQAHD